MLAPKEMPRAFFYLRDKAYTAARASAAALGEAGSGAGGAGGFYDAIEERRCREDAMEGMKARLRAMGAREEHAHVREYAAANGLQQRLEADLVGALEQCLAISAEGGWGFYEELPSETGFERQEVGVLGATCNPKPQTPNP